jgi:small subunit ribosomal protein S5
MRLFYVKQGNQVNKDEKILTVNMENTQKTKPGNRKRPNNTSKWKERVVQIKRVTKVCKGGKKLSFRAVVIIGNEEGKIGVGVGKADDIINAIKKSITSAKRNIKTIVLTKTKTIPHKVDGVFGACHVLMRPAPQGTGVIAGSSIRTVLELVGVKNISAKQLGGKNILNNARATVCALENLKNAKIVSIERNVPMEKLK